MRTFYFTFILILIIPVRVYPSINELVGSYTTIEQGGSLNVPSLKKMKTKDFGCTDYPQFEVFIVNNELRTTETHPISGESRKYRFALKATIEHQRANGVMVTTLGWYKRKTKRNEKYQAELIKDRSNEKHVFYIDYYENLEDRYGTKDPRDLTKEERFNTIVRRNVNIFDQKESGLLHFSHYDYIYYQYKGRKVSPKPDPVPTCRYLKD